MNTTSGRSCAPVRRHERGRGNPDASPVISLAGWARAIREHHQLTRREAESVTGVSSDYLKNIETGWRPSPDYLEKLITGYRLDHAQQRLTWDLWRPPVHLAPAEELRDRITTPDRIELLTRLDKAGILAAYVDPLWHILAANSTFYQVLPDARTVTGGNVAAWAMPPAPAPSPAKPLFLDPQSEGHILFGMLRGAIGRYRDSPHVIRLYQQLARNDAFRRHWHTGIHVAYGRHIEQIVHLRNPATGKPYTLDVQIAKLAHFPEVRSVIAWPPPPEAP